MYLQTLVFNRTRKRIRDLLGLMEGVRTEELSGSNLHNYLNRLIKKRTKIFSHSLPILYQNEIEMSILSKSLSLEFPTDCIGFTDILPFYIWGFLKLRNKLFLFSLFHILLYSYPKNEQDNQCLYLWSNNESNYSITNRYKGMENPKR